ncbi:nudix hydrolase 15, mitochondrial-like isoform X2 [Asparagus officinalis]|uniref:nudix hydrolase 15, mitochondrial-like isoform X2 n=1 Tax=Asparagus officinalis TaxID=4686 RepID=UPI00098DF8C4|nr:nudix hydrolase 15, mitochondrial-like isoform X2 [Asparagus officinalis]
MRLQFRGFLRFVNFMGIFYKTPRSGDFVKFTHARGMKSNCECLFESNSIPKPILNPTFHRRRFRESESTPRRKPQNPMDSTRRLLNLIEQLRIYKPQQDEDDGIADGEDVGVDESAAGRFEPLPARFRPKKAAVLICLFENELGQLRVILTKRSSTLSTHAGEVSLPGGKAEEGDEDDKATALREAKEEIGLDPSLVCVVAVLEPFLSKHLLRVVPVIGILSDRKAFTPVANSSEVETVFDAPLDMFLKDENRRSEERERMGYKFLIHYFDFESESRRIVIWGFTARILIRAASVVYQMPPAFPDGKPKFKIQHIVTKNNTS